MHWLYDNFFGVRQPIWISGVSNLTVFGLLVSVLHLFRRLNCTKKSCWRIGHEKVLGTTYRTCRLHTTQTVHDQLKDEHAVKYPEQHALLNSQPREIANSLQEPMP